VANTTRPKKDPEADCPTVEEYEIRRRDRMAALPEKKAPK
jgi:hypothetical protein